MENEFWKPIVGYEGLYEISNLGRVKSLSRVIKSCYGSTQLHKEVIKKTWINKQGYVSCMFKKDCKQVNILLHRIIAQAFIPNPENKPQINHINGIKHDNRLENLERVTASENGLHSYRILGNKATGGMLGKFGKNNCRSKRISQYKLDGSFVREWDSMSDVERELGFYQGSISMCCLGKKKQVYGYIRKFIQNNSVEK